MENMKHTTSEHKVKKTRRTLGGRVAHIIGIILCILLLPGFIVNTTLLISSLIYPDIPPSFMGYTPLVVESDSMSPYFMQDDLVLIRNGQEGDLYEKGSIICFQSGDMYITHRIVKITDSEDGSILYTTQGDANNTPDVQPVRPEQILGCYVTHFNGLGGFVMFMQTPAGMVYCVLLPIFVIFSLFWITSKIADWSEKRKQKTNPSIY